jgi:hypothetical protein
MNPAHDAGRSFGGAFSLNAAPQIATGMLGRPFQRPSALRFGRYGGGELASADEGAAPR